MGYFLKAIPVLIFWGIFGLVILKVPYPNTLTSTNASQLLAFFIPLFLALTFTFNTIFNFYPRSISLSFGVIIILVLKALGSLNLVSAILTLTSIFLLFSYFRKRPELTSRRKIPKLTQWRKHHTSS